MGLAQELTFSKSPPNFEIMGLLAPHKLIHWCNKTELQILKGFDNKLQVYYKPCEEAYISECWGNYEHGMFRQPVL